MRIKSGDKRSVENFIELNRYVETDSRVNVVYIVTIHSSKGLEFDTVIMPDFDIMHYPSSFINSNIEEEKRLFYVAVTRAKNRIFFSTYRKISPFYEYIKDNISFNVPEKKYYQPNFFDSN